MMDFSTLGQNALFVSSTFAGMMVGTFPAGFVGDRFGRRFAYQACPLVFGLASIIVVFLLGVERARKRLEELQSGTVRNPATAKG